MFYDKKCKIRERKNVMKQLWKKGLVFMSMCVLLAGCIGQGNDRQGDIEQNHTEITDDTEQLTGDVLINQTEKKVFENAVAIELSDEVITVDGSEISKDAESAVYAANDIVFYLENQGFTYGEGTAEDEHSQEEADAHTVVHITEPGTYAVSGKLSAGQIAIDLGEEAKENPEAVVTLILNGAEINCSVAPAVIFYNVYECGSKDTETATNTVDTAAAGANVIIADDTVNEMNGSYVARIYKSYELNEEGTEVVDNKKLHKYDAAFYSKMSMNINGEEKGNGILNIKAENEGLDSELHLTLNGGMISIESGNDGINTNEDGVSVTTVNGGNLRIKVTGETGEGDGIDSNGWLVINGGTVTASACSTSGDAGIDSDMGIHINGGTVIASGNMLDRISESTQNYAVFQFNSRQTGGVAYSLRRETFEQDILPENDFSYLIVSSPELISGTYTLWQGETQLAASTGNGMGGMGRPNGFGGGQRPENMELPEGVEMPEGMEKPERFDGGKMPEHMEMPEGAERPEGMQRPENGQFPNGESAGEVSVEFTVADGGNYFNNVSVAEE